MINQSEKIKVLIRTKINLLNHQFIFSISQNQSSKIHLTSFYPNNINMLYECFKPIQLMKEYNIVQFFSLAYNDTYVVCSRDSDRNEYLTHYDLQGNCLFQKRLEEGQKAYGMIVDNEVTILEANKNTITQFNLQTHSEVCFQHQTAFLQSDCSELLEMFSQTKAICVKQNADHKENRFKLTYYLHPFDKQTKPKAVFLSKQKEWRYDYQLNKGNNRSLMIWFDIYHRNQLEFHTFHLDDNQTGKYKSYVISLTSLSFVKENRQLAISNIWKTKNNQFLAVYSGILIQEHGQTYQKNIIVLDVNQNTAKQLPSTIQILKDQYLIQEYNLGECTILNCYSMLKPQGISQTVRFFLDHQTLKIIKVTRQESTHLLHGKIIEFDNSSFLDDPKQEIEKQKVLFRLSKFMRPQFVMLHFMLHIYQNFEDDLLQDSLQLMDLI